MNRRSFTKKSVAAAAFIAVKPMDPFLAMKDHPRVRLGGPLFGKFNNPGDWIKVIAESGYKAVYCPLQPSATQEEIKAYKEAARRADVIIAEVGAWSNPISPNEEERREALDKCLQNLHLADEIEANCCVNISGSRNKHYWAGPHKDNLNDQTFDMVVETTRKIIDGVKPTRTWFTLEAMPWSFPHSADAYIRLIKAVNRKQFGVHLDPVNMIVSPEIYFNNGAMIKECFRKLGPFMKSCHAKDIQLREDIYTPHLTEVMPGQGQLNYRVFLRELAKLNNVPLMLEHLQTEAEYKQAAEYIRSVGKECGIDQSP